MGNFSGFQKSDDIYIHPRFGQIKRIQKQNGPQLVEHKVLIQSQDVIDNWAKDLNIIQSLGCDSTLLLPKSFFKQKVGYCGGSYDVYLLYEDYMFSLKDELKNRRNIGRFFPESSIWEILYKLVKVEKLLSNFKFSIGNVKTENILVNQQGDFKILCKYTYPNIQDSISISIENSDRFYSPEEWMRIRSLVNQSQKIRIKKQSTAKSSSNIGSKESTDEQLTEIQIVDNQQIFSIGITLLEICTLQESKFLYTDKGVDEELIKKRFKQMEGKYTKNLIKLLFQMLRFDPQIRIKAATIEKTLDDHKEKIMNHESFNISTKFNNPFESNISSVLIEEKIEVKNKGCQEKDKKDSKGESINFFFQQMSSSLHETESDIMYRKECERMHMTVAH